MFSVRRKRGHGWSGVRLVEGVLDGDNESSEPSSNGLSDAEVEAEIAAYENELW